jgi:sulfonate transport system substrate-binding protein
VFTTVSAENAGRREETMTVRSTILSILAAAGILVASAAYAEPVTLRVGWVSITADGPFLMFGKEGVAKHVGVSYTLEPIHFQGSPQMLTALASNAVDIGGLGFSTLPIAVQNAHLTDLRVIADLFQDGAPGHYSNRYLVLKDSAIRTIEDMKGKVAATNSAGSAVDMALRTMLRKHGLEEKRDYTIIEAAFPNMPAILKEHKADLIASTRLATADPAIRNMTRTLFTQREAIGRSEMSMVVARLPFLEKNRAVVIDYLEDSLRLLRWYSDPAHHDEAVKSFADFTKQPPSAFASWMFVKGEDFYHDPDGLPDLDALEANVAIERDLGFTKSALDVKPLVDLRYVKEAAQRAK